MAKELSRLNVSLTAQVGRFNRGMSSAEKRLKRFRGAAHRANVMLLRMAGAVAGIAALRETTRVIAGFEQSMATIRGVTKASTEQMQAMATQARELGATTQHSAAAAADAMLNLSRSGFTVNEVLATTPSVLNLATGAQLDLASSSKLVSNTLRQFGLNVGQAAHVTDVLVTASNKATTTVPMVGEALGKVGPLASAFGISLEETTSALAVLASISLEGSEAGTNLRGVIAGLAEVTPEAERVIANLGLSLDDVNIQSVGLTEAMRRLGEAGASPTQMLQIFDRRAVSAAVALAENADSADDLQASLHNSTGAAKDLAREMEDSLGGVLKELRSSIEEVMLSAGENGLLGIIRTLTEEMTAGLRDTTGEADKMGIVMENVTNHIALVGDAVQLVHNKWLELRKIYRGAQVDAEIAGSAIGSALAVVGDKAVAAMDVVSGTFRSLWNSLEALLSLGAWGLVKAVATVGKALVGVMRTAAIGLQESGIGHLIDMGSALESASNSIANFVTGQEAISKKRFRKEQVELAESVRDTADAYERLTADIFFAEPAASKATELAYEQAKAQAAAAASAERWSVGFLNSVDKYSRAIEKKKEADKKANDVVRNLGNPDIPTTDSTEPDVESAVLNNEKTIVDSLARIRQAEKQAAVESEALWRSSWRGKAEIVSGILGNLSTLMQSESRSMFEVGKIAAIGQATVDTIVGAQRVFTALAFNPPLAYSAAAAAYAAGLVRVNLIRQTSFGGGGSAPSGVSSGAAASGGGESAANTSTAEPDRSLQIQLPTVGADQFISVERLRDLTKEAKRRNIPLVFA